MFDIFQVLSGLAKVMKECWHEDSNVRLPALRYLVLLFSFVSIFIKKYLLVLSGVPFIISFFRIKKSLLKIAADDPKLGMSLDD